MVQRVESGTHVLEIHNLYKRYKSGTVANRSLSISLDESEFVCVMGPNGAGKSTLIRQISALLRPTSGTIRVCGLDARRDPRKVKAKIGYQPQHLSGLSELTFFEALYFLGRLRRMDKKALTARIREISSALQTEPVLKKRLDRISGGYRRLLGVSLALLPEPPLLLLDEPTAGLDPVHRRLVWRQIHHHQERGAAVLVASHNLAEVQTHMDRYAIMVDGEWVKEGDFQVLAEEAEAEALVSIRIDPVRGQEGALEEALTQMGVCGQYDAEQRCLVASGRSSVLLDALQRGIGRLARMSREIKIERGSLESYYLEAVRRKGAT